MAATPGQPASTPESSWGRGEQGIFASFRAWTTTGTARTTRILPANSVGIGVRVPRRCTFRPVPGRITRSRKGFAVLGFVNEHKEIGLAVVFGGARRLGSCAQRPARGRRSWADSRVHQDMAEFVGTRLRRDFRGLPPGPAKASPQGAAGGYLPLIADFLGLGAAVNPLLGTEILRGARTKYKGIPQGRGLDEKRLAPRPTGRLVRAVRLLSLGLPSFAVDLDSPKQGGKAAPGLGSRRSWRNDRRGVYRPWAKRRSPAFLKTSGAPLV